MIYREFQDNSDYQTCKNEIPPIARELSAISGPTDVERKFGKQSILEGVVANKKREANSQHPRGNEARVDHKTKQPCEIERERDN